MFTFPDEAQWNEELSAVEFRVQLGEYEGKVIVERRVLQGLIGHRPTPEECVQQVHLQRPLFERAAEARIRARALDKDANIRLTGRDLRAVAG